MTRIRRTSFVIPDPVSYAQAAVATIGIKKFTHGCVSHAIQVHHSLSLSLSLSHTHTHTHSPLLTILLYVSHLCQGLTQTQCQLWCSFLRVLQTWHVLGVEGERNTTLART